MKVLLLGLTGAGKTTVAKNVANKYNLNLIEADDEVIKLNGGHWPNSEEIIDRYFEVTNDKVMGLDNVLYIISWLIPERINEFYNKDFIIIELHADFNELLRRKISRDGVSDEEKKRFRKNYLGYVKDILSDKTKRMLTLSLDTTKLSSEEIMFKVNGAVADKICLHTLRV